jgi:glycosyltransferase involved in cell wall biosynthesis
MVVAQPGQKLRVLLIAEACNPRWVSVPLVGWSHSCAIARLTDAHIVTQIRNREALLGAGLVEGKDFTAIDSEAVAAKVYQLGTFLRGGSGTGWTTNTALATLAYYYFEELAWKSFGERIRQHEFDVVHRLTPLSPTIPSLIARKCRRAGVPFVIGPLNGGVAWPRAFDAARRREKEWLSYVRGASKLLPGYRSTRRNTAAMLIASRDTWEQVPAKYHRKCVYIPENAIDPARFTFRRMRAATRPVRVVFLGRLVPYKGADMLLEAATPLVRMGKLTVEIIGDGPQMPELKEFVRREDLATGVTLCGWVEHEKVQDRLAQADVFAFPSIREFGGGAVLEAMAVGLVPIVIDYAGPAELVTERTGFLLPMGTRQQIVQRLAALLNQLAENPAIIDAQSGPALRRAHELFTWDVKARRVLDVYEWVTGRRADKPDFGMPWPDG